MEGTAMIKKFDEFLNEAIKYKPDDFNLDNAPKELVQYVIDNVDDFGRRYQKALTKIDRMRCPLRMADSNLYNEICDNVEDWCSDNDENFLICKNIKMK